ncbi:hypothetical protein K1719_010702 [Acacia pycnantha]|nr:hypothetical protein K1719_010702 [Acacia pycnantha]
MGKGSAKKRGRDVLPPTSAEKKPVEIDESRLAKRKYAQAYRWRRQNHLEQLENETKKLEAEIAQKNETYNALEAENSTIRSEIAAWKQKHEIEKLTAKIEKLERKIEAKLKVAKNDQV